MIKLLCIIIILLGIHVILLISSFASTYKDLNKLYNKFNEIQITVSKDPQITESEQSKLLRNQLYEFFNINQEEDKIYAVVIDEQIVDHKTNHNINIHTTVAVDISDKEIRCGIDMHKSLFLSTYNDTGRVMCINILKAIYGYLAKSTDTVEHFYIKSNCPDREKGIWFDGYWEKQYTTYYTFSVMTVPKTTSLYYINTDYGKKAIIWY